MEIPFDHCVSFYNIARILKKGKEALQNAVNAQSKIKKTYH
jgi:hypothetical protein